MNTREDKLAAFDRLLTIMDELREQCPWDRKQTMLTLKNLTIEETYELVDSVTTGDMDGIKEELGDILLHMIFYSKIGEEQQAFDIADVLNAQCDKLIHRHPHVYGNLKVTDEDEVKRNWEQLKLQEGKKSVLEGVPTSLPALIKAYRIQDKAGQVNFQWENTAQVWEKVREEMGELQEHVSSKEPLQDRLEDEFGDVLFALVNLSRYIEVDPELALDRTNKKFMRRFSYIEERAEAMHTKLSDMTLAEMDALWDEAKKRE